VVVPVQQEVSDCSLVYRTWCGVEITSENGTRLLLFDGNPIADPNHSNAFPNQKPGDHRQEPLIDVFPLSKPCWAAGGWDGPHPVTLAMYHSLHRSSNNSSMRCCSLINSDLVIGDEAAVESA
jgi:hypothetical protein